MLLKVGAVLASIPLALGAVVAGTGVVVVDVKEAAGHRIVIPVPLLLAEMAASLAPAQATRHALEHIEKAQRYLPVAEEVVAALAASPDAELVRVDDRDEQVRVSKVGDTIQVRVKGRREQVSVNIPIELVHDALRQAHHGRIDAAGLVATLRRQARLTDLVEVVDGDEHVKISVW